MADLLDILPATAAVWIDGQRITVQCVSIPAMASIVVRFPELKDVLGGGLGDTVVPSLIASCGSAVGPIIAAGCRRLGDEKFEQHAAGMLPEYQLKLLNAIFAVSFPNGIGSFVEELTRLLGGAGQKAKAVKMRSRKLPSISPPSSEADSRQTLQ